jgi:hypothetical protein
MKNTKNQCNIFSVKDEINKFVSGIHQETYSLEQACGGSFIFPTPERTESVRVHLILPFCLRVGSARKGQSDENLCSEPCGICLYEVQHLTSSDAPRIRQSDISFTLTVIFHALNPPQPRPTTGSTGCVLYVKSSSFCVVE